MSENGSRAAGRDAAGLPDVLTVVAIAIVATVVADVTHEALGHGGACLLSGAIRSRFLPFILIAIATRA